MALPWVTLSPTTYCYINGTKLYEESSLGSQDEGSAFALLHLGLRHCSMISRTSYNCGTRWPVGSETMLYIGAQHFSPSVNTCCSTSISTDYIRATTDASMPLSSSRPHPFLASRGRSSGRYFCQPAEKTLHINMLDLEAIHRAILHWLR